MAGFDRTALRYGSEQFGKTQHAAWSATIRLSLVMSALGGSIAGALLAFFAPDIASFFSKPNVVPIIRILAAAVPLMSIGGVAVASIRSKQDFRPYVIWGFVMPALLSCLGLVAAWGLNAGLTGVAIALAIGSISAGFGALFIAWGHTNSNAPVSISRLPLFIFAATMMVYIGGSQLVQQIDRLMIGAFLPSQELGIYDAAAILSAHITIFLTALNSIVAPKISAAFHSGKKEVVKALFQLETRWVWNLSIPLFLAL
ncbi:MAG TPA: hypothetical protein EYO58_01750, partial [Flavobacteriales bacterium]|nr:hypothetical protein [Flavobacteriales bacterium]